jgi:F-type H+-transporting ATPase subunit b
MKILQYSFILLLPAVLFASSEASGPTDIIPRTINFLIFAGILYYFVAGAAKEFYFGRKERIAQQLDSIQSKLKESNAKKEEALQKVEEAKANVRALIETAKKEAILVSEKIALDAVNEMENLEKAFLDKMNIEERHMQRVIVNEVLDELFKQGSLILDEKEIVNIISKKVA